MVILLLKEMFIIEIKNIKQGEFFTLKDIEEPKESQVYIKGEYDRASKTYSCYKFSDVNDFRSFKSNRDVFINFTF